MSYRMSHLRSMNQWYGICDGKQK